MFHVLVALADGDKHGYAILKEVRRRSEGRVKLSAGTLYAVIKRLLDAEMITESGNRPDPALDDERRRYFRLTSFGRRMVVAEADRMVEALALAREKRLIRKPRFV